MGRPGSTQEYDVSDLVEERDDGVYTKIRILLDDDVDGGGVVSAVPAGTLLADVSKLPSQIPEQHATVLVRLADCASAVGRWEEDDHGRFFRLTDWV